jgi:2-dehydro-3-deoxyphosphogluconate aldolase / (4S)-4-hydroxy-2-oxoglutarate aldolase
MVKSSRSVAEAFAVFGHERLIAIIRANNSEDAYWAAAQALESGFQLVEITWTTPDVLSVIARLAQNYPQAVIGAGTVLSTIQAQQSIEAGAGFLVSPILDEDVVRFGVDHDCLTLPGILTPTEMYHASQWGAPAVKLFPAASVGGPTFIQAVKGPFPTAQIVATGGLTLDDIDPYLRAGCLAVGIGSPLMSESLIRGRDERALRERCRMYLTQRDTAMAF